MLRDAVINHIIATLPETISDRRDLLKELVASLPISHPKRSAVEEILYRLDQHQLAQREFIAITVPAGEQKGKSK